MKKNLLMLLVLMCAPLLSGCGSGEKLTGSDAAKILLAEERLDADALKNSKIDFDYTKTAKRSKKSSTRSVANTTFAQDREVKRAKSATDTEAEKKGNVITWTNFGEYSNGISYFDQFVTDIEKKAKSGADLIDSAKNRVDANNVWITSLFNDILLQVSSNEDTVMMRNDKGYQIVTRTLDEQGVDCFDIFTGNMGEKYGSRVRKLGDYRYEYSYVTEDRGYEHYFIADNSRGYWIVQSPVNQRTFSTTIIKDDRCYEFSTEIGMDEISSLQVMTSDRLCDVVNVWDDTTWNFYCGAFTNIESMSIETSEDRIDTLENYNYTDNIDVIYNDNDYGTTGSKSVNLHLKNGKTLKEGDSFVGGKVSYVRGMVALAADGMMPEFSIAVQGDTRDEKIANVEQFLKETGLTFVRDYNSIIDSIKTAYTEALNTMSSISWNGILLDSEEAYAKAREVEVAKLPAFVERYNNVKDNTELTRNQQGRLDRNTAFPYIVNSSFTANYSDNVVNIDSATARVDDFTLFENGKQYNMQYALAQYDEENEGYFNLLPIEVNNPSYVTYDGQQQLTLSTSNLSFVLPVPSQGTYELVTYIADEEGIRVTRPQPVKFGNVKTNEISIHNYTAEVSKTDEGLLGINSVTNDNLVLVIKDAKEVYTYDELYKLLSSEAYNYGIVSSTNVEMLNSSGSWEMVNKNSQSLTSGTYRLQFTNQNDALVYVSTSF